ncbi:MAG: ATP-dependent protease LonB, partial [Candidatus Methanomethylophilaceae archaeon]|nr:ATP-dependent protease LonB [Candidatus Methanomethylophilaceae archaeon]
LIRIAGDMAVNNGNKVVTSEHVMLARETARSLEQQIADKQIEGMMRYQLFHNSGEAVGLINGLAVLSNGNSSEMSGMVMPLAAEVTPAQSKKGGKIIATGQLGKIAQEAVDNISAVIKKYTLTDLSALDIHIEYVAAYNGVDGDSASVTMATVIISALENIPIRQDLAMTGSLNVRGTVMPIGGVTAKLEAAANSGIKVALIPKENEKDVMIDRKYYDMMEIYTMQTLRDVFEYAFVDCPAKQKYLDALLPLNPSGESTAEKVKIPPKYKKDRKRSKVAKKEPVAEEAETVAEPEEVEVTVEVESED